MQPAVTITYTRALCVLRGDSGQGSGDKTRRGLHGNKDRHTRVIKVDGGTCRGDSPARTASFSHCRGIDE